jgi:hypothetical protein
MGWESEYEALPVSGVDDGKTAITPTQQTKGWASEYEQVGDAPAPVRKPLAPAKPVAPPIKTKIGIYTLRRSPKILDLLKSRDSKKYEAAQKLLSEVDDVMARAEGRGFSRFKSKPSQEEFDSAAKKRDEAEKILNDLLPESGANGRRWINDLEAKKLGLINELPRGAIDTADRFPEGPGGDAMRRMGMKPATQSGRWYDLDPKTGEFVAAQEEQANVDRAEMAKSDAAIFPSLETGGVSQGIQGVAGTVARVGEKLGVLESGTADASVRLGQAKEDVSVKRDGGSYVGKMIRGTTNSLTQMAIGTLAGVATGGASTAATITPAVIGTFGSVAANEAYTNGIDAGMSEPEAKEHAVRQGLIEGGITAAFQVAGLGGLESAFFKEQGKALAKDALGRIVKNMTAEQLEELTVSAASEFAARASGMTPSDLPTLLADTFLQTAFTMGLIDSPTTVRTAAKELGGMAAPDVHSRAANARKWIAENPGYAEFVASQVEQGKPITRNIMKAAGLKTGQEGQRQRFGELVYRTVRGEKVPGAEFGDVATEVPEAVEPGVAAAKPEEAFTEETPAEPVMRDARRALGNYVAQQGYDVDKKKRQNMDLDPKYQALKAAAEAESRSESAKIAARSKKEKKGERDDAFLDVALGAVTRENVAFAPTKNMHPTLAAAVRKEAEAQLARSESPATKAALEKIIAGEDEGGADVEKQRERMVGLLLGEVDEREGNQRQAQAPRPADPIVTLMLQPEAERTRAVRKAMNSVADGNPNALADYAYNQAAAKLSADLPADVDPLDAPPVEPTEEDVMRELDSLLDTVKNPERASIESEVEPEFGFGEESAEGSDAVPMGDIGLPDRLPDEAKASQPEEFGGRRKTSPIAKVFASIKQILGDNVVSLVESPDGMAIRIGLANGKSFTIAITAPIRPNVKQRAAFEDSVGRTVTDEEFYSAVSNGTFQLTMQNENGRKLDVGDGLIRLSKGIFKPTTTAHELLHAARAFGLFTDAEWNALKKKYAKKGMSERQAEEAIARAQEEWQATSAGWKKLRLLVDKILSLFKSGMTATRAQAAFSSGEVFGRNASTAVPTNEELKIRWSQPAFSAGLSETSTTSEVESARRAWVDLSFKSPWFQRWFGGSKIADKHGLPIRMYHGTTAEFESFDMGRADPGALYGPGIYMTESPEVAAGDTGYTTKGVFSDDNYVETLIVKPGETKEQIAARVKELVARDVGDVEDQFIFTKEGYSGDTKAVEVYVDEISSPNVMPLYASIKKPFDIDLDMPNYDRDLGRLQDLYPEVDFDYSMEKLREFEDNTGTPTGREVYTAIVKSNDEDGNRIGKARANVMLQALGYDGIVHTGGLSGRYGGGKPHKVAIAFDPSQVKSAMGNQGTFDKESDNVLFSAEEKPRSIWRDNILSALTSWQPKGTPEQLKKHLEKTRGALDQADWIGLDEFLAGKKSVTKKEVEDFTRENSVEVNDVLIGAPDPIPEGLLKRYEELQDKQDEVGLTPEEVRQLEIIDRTVSDYSAAGESAAKYARYQTPGGANYRELLLTLPENPSVNKGPVGWATVAGGTRDDANFHSSHFDVPNILAHVRYNERTTADGKRMLFLEEVQSDWHQQGRRTGYKTGIKRTKPADGTIVRQGRNGRWFIAESELGFENAQRLFSGMSTEQEAIDSSYGEESWHVPDAPFKQTWPMLAMKRMIQHAAENGFESIGWTTGEMQAARYDLSQQIDHIDYRKAGTERYELGIVDKNNQEVLIDQEDSYTLEEIEKNLGKEIAEKIANGEGQAGGGRMTLSGLDLKVGGKGMIGFYDKILPAEVNKFVKKWGAKVGTSEIETNKLPSRYWLEPSGQDDGKVRINIETENGNVKDELGFLSNELAQERIAKLMEKESPRIASATVHSLPVNESMVAAAAEGMPLFSATGPAVKYERPKGGAVGSWIRWLLTSAGDLPKKAFALKENMQQFLAAHDTSARMAVTDMRIAMKRTYGRNWKLNENARAAVDAVLRGGDVKLLPPALRDPVWRMRSHIDKLSRMIIQSGVANENLEATIEENMGVYLTRTYRFHADKNWSKRVPVEIRNRAEVWVRDQLMQENGRLFPPTENEVQSEIKQLLYSDPNSPMGMIANGKLGSKLLDVLKARKELPLELRELWGEETNPLINYAASVAKMTKLLAGQRFLVQARAAGMGKWLFDPKDPERDPEAMAPIAAAGSEVMNPLNGLLTYPEVKAAFENEFKRRDLNPMFKFYLGLNSMAKVAKTVGSVKSQVRNNISNPLFLAANGNWNPLHMGDAIAGAIPGLEGVPILHSLGKAMGQIRHLGNLDYDAWREFHIRLVKNGVIGEEVSIGEFKSLLNEADLENGNRLVNNFVTKAMRKTGEAAAKVYAGSDSFWKIFAWSNERAKYKRAYPEWSDEQLDKHAADIVRNTMPTYAKIPKGVQALRYVPFGNFFSWSAEIIRVTLKTFEQAAIELKEPRTRLIGAQRLAGASAMVILPEIIVGSAWFMAGATKGDDEDRREFIPPWSKNSQIAWLGDGKYLDISFIDPYAYVRKSVHAYLRGDDEGVLNGAMEAAKEFAAPFTDEQLLGERLTDLTLRRGKTAEGREIFNPQDDLATKASKSFKHVAEVLVPGTFTDIGNINKAMNGYVGDYGKVYDLDTELKAFMGLRVSKIDMSQSLKLGKVPEYDRAMTDSNQLFTSVAKNVGVVPAEALAAAYDRADNARRRNFENMHDVAWKAIRQGMAKSDVIDILRATGVSKDESDRLIDGKYKPYMPAPAMLAEIAKADDGENRVASIYSLWISRSPDPAAAEAEVREEIGDRLKSSYTTLRRSRDRNARKERTALKRGETADERTQRLEAYEASVRKAEAAIPVLERLQQEEFGGKRAK